MKRGRSKRATGGGKARPITEEEAEQVRKLATKCHQADGTMERELVGRRHDLIAYTVWAYKRQHLESLPPQALVVGECLRALMAKVQELTEDRVCIDDLLAIWEPIVNRRHVTL